MTVEIFVILLGVWVDVAAVDADGGRSQEPNLFGGLLAADVDQPDLSVAGKLCANLLDQRDRGVAVGAARSSQHLDKGRSVGWCLAGWAGGGQL